MQWDSVRFVRFTLYLRLVYELTSQVLPPSAESACSKSREFVGELQTIREALGNRFCDQANQFPPFPLAEILDDPRHPGEMLRQHFLQKALALLRVGVARIPA
jgi:hypothetical protein